MFSLLQRSRAEEEGLESLTLSARVSLELALKVMYVSQYLNRPMS